MKINSAVASLVGIHSLSTALAKDRSPSLGEFRARDGKIQSFVSMKDAVLHRSAFLKENHFDPDTVVGFNYTNWHAAIQQGNCWNYVTSTTAKRGEAGRLPGNQNIDVPYNCFQMKRLTLAFPGMRENFQSQCKNGEREIYLYLLSHEEEDQDFHYTACEQSVCGHKVGDFPAETISKTQATGELLYIPEQMYVFLNEHEEGGWQRGLSSTFVKCPTEFCLDLSENHVLNPEL